MEKRQVLASYYLSLAVQVGGIVLLLLLVTASVLFNINQQQTIEQLKEDAKTAEKAVALQAARLRELESEKKNLADDLDLAALEKADLSSNVSALTLRIARLDSQIRVSLDSLNKTCTGDAENCIEELANCSAPEQPEPVCSQVKDDACPPECSAATDYDCCESKGNKWVAGEGCYSK